MPQNPLFISISRLSGGLLGGLRGRQGGRVLGRLRARGRSGVVACTFAATGLLAACGDSPTGPDTRIVIDATEQELAAAHVMVDDITSRLFPSISELSGVAELNAAVAALSDAVNRADAEQIDEGAERAANALERVRAASTEAEAADITAIDLAIEEAKRLLRYPTQTPAGSPNLRAPK